MSPFFKLQVFPDVTILFSDVVKFNEICIHITPMQVVDMLNEIYIVFDTLSEKHNVYKVSEREGSVSVSRTRSGFAVGVLAIWRPGIKSQKDQCGRPTRCGERLWS